jgi:malonate-semialdehyde dehydrogenase (acetylating) / methylmalonate-semialdehyde dehydrogenase
MTAQNASLAGNYVNGSWRESGSSTVMKINNPATSETLASITLAESEDVDAAVQAAAAAFPTWRRTPPQERIRYLFKLKRLLEEHAEEIARRQRRRTGKRWPSRTPSCNAALRTSKWPAAFPP